MPAQYPYPADFPKAFQDQAFQEPDPVNAFQPYAFQDQAFQFPVWVGGFQDSAFQDDVFQETADAFQDGMAQGDSFQLDVLPGTVLPSVQGNRVFVFQQRRSRLVARRGHRQLASERAPLETQTPRKTVGTRRRPRPPARHIALYITGVSTPTATPLIRPVVIVINTHRTIIRARLRHRNAKELAGARVAPAAAQPGFRFARHPARVAARRRLRKARLLRSPLTILRPRVPPLRPTGRNAKEARLRAIGPRLLRAPLESLRPRNSLVERPSRQARVARLRASGPRIVRAALAPAVVTTVKLHIIVALDVRRPQLLRLGRVRRHLPKLIRPAVWTSTPTPYVRPGALVKASRRAATFAQHGRLLRRRPGFARAPQPTPPPPIRPKQPIVRTDVRKPKLVRPRRARILRSLVAPFRPPPPLVRTSRRSRQVARMHRAGRTLKPRLWSHRPRPVAPAPSVARPLRRRRFRIWIRSPRVFVPPVGTIASGFGSVRLADRLPFDVALADIDAELERLAEAETERVALADRDAFIVTLADRAAFKSRIGDDPGG